MIKIIQFILAFTLALILVGCGGGSGGTSSGGGTTFQLSPVQIPISIQDKLVTVTVTQGTTTLAFFDRLFDFARPALNFIATPAYASQISPTLSSQATAKIVAGQVVLVNPIFSANVMVSDPAHPDKIIQKTVNVRCDTSSIPVTIHVNKAWALNYLTGDLLVNMSYPASVTATYDQSTNTFSACSYVYSSGYFIVYGDNSVSTQLDSTLGEVTQAGCIMDIGLLGVVAAGDPARNPTSNPIINSIFDSSFVSINGYSLNPLCGSMRAMSYSKTGGQTFTTLKFNIDVLPTNANVVVDSAQNVYAIGSDRNYGGGAISPTCPIAVTQIGSAGSTCITLPNTSSYINYPITATQLQAGGMYGTGQVQKPYPFLFLGGNGLPELSLQTYAGMCGIGSCFGPISSPTLFNIDPALVSATLVPTPALNASGFPWGFAGMLTPIGVNNGYLMFSMGGLGNGILANITTGAVIQTCSSWTFNTMVMGCGEAVSFGNYVYGFTKCGGLAGCTDSMNRTNVTTGVIDHWDLKSLGFIPVASMSNSTNTMSLGVRPIYYTDQVVFLACPSPFVTCPLPNWVSLNYATSQITPVTTGGITFDMLSTVVATTLW